MKWNTDESIRKAHRRTLSYDVRTCNSDVVFLRFSGRIQFFFFVRYELFSQIVML